MGTFLLFAIPFSLVGWLIYRAIRYTNESVGEASPLKRVVVYEYKALDFLQWRQTPLIILIALFLYWVCWILLTNLDTATSPLHYVLTCLMLALCAGSFYLISKLLQLEDKFQTIIEHTALALDPATMSITVHRSGTSTVLTASSLAFIESHITAQGKFSYTHFRFVDHEGHDTFFFDYGKGLGFAIEDYFKGVPMKYVEHKFPFNTVQVA